MAIGMKSRRSAKPQIVNFRMRWDKVIDLTAAMALWGMTMWIMVLLTAIVFRTL